MIVEKCLNISQHKFVRSGCSVLGVLDSGDKFFKGKGLIYFLGQLALQEKVLDAKVVF